MKYKLILISLVSIIVLFSFFTANRDFRANKTQNPNQRQKINQESYETKTDGRGAVSISVVPRVLGKDSAQWNFIVTFNTHSAELDQDIMQIATLVDNIGNVYKPVAWEGAGPGGHHREGLLTFNAVSPVPQSIELKIQDVGGISERTFKWDVK